MRIRQVSATIVLLALLSACQSKVDGPAPSGQVKEIEQTTVPVQPAGTNGPTATTAVPKPVEAETPDDEAVGPDVTTPQDNTGKPAEGTPIVENGMEQPGPVTGKKTRPMPGIAFGMERVVMNPNAKMQMRNVQVSDSNDGKPGVSKNFRLTGGVYLTK